MKQHEPFRELPGAAAAVGIECGATSHKRQYVRQRSGHTCEHCLLKARKRGLGLNEHPYEQFVESLAETMDLRELETDLHSKFDGSGYPEQLKGDEIPLAARLFAVIDTLDAMTFDRPYRKALSFDSAMEEILRMSGTQFDPEAVATFLKEERALRETAMMKYSTAIAEQSAA